MQFPITIGLHRSFFLGLAIIGGHALAAAAMLVPPWSPGLKAFLLVIVAGSAAWAWRSRQRTVDCLRLHEDGRLECRLAGEGGFVEALLQPAATVHPWLTVVPMRIAGRKVVVVIPPDSIRAEDFRRLRVWLRWRAEFRDEASAA